MFSFDNKFSELSEKHEKIYNVSIIIIISVFSAVLFLIGWFVFINMRSNSPGDQRLSDASALNYACQDVYFKVRTGEINNTMTSCDGSIVNWAADENDGIAVKEEAAAKVTLKQVQIYCGTDISLDEMYYADNADPTQNISKGQILVISSYDDKPNNIILIPLSE